MMSDILVNIGSDNGLSPVRCQALTEPMLTYCQLEPQEQTSIIFFYQNTNNFFIIIASENVVCKMSAILFQS